MGSECWYLTERWGVHDQRWIAALEAQGFRPRVLSCERDSLDTRTMRAMIENDSPGMPVLAGPLTSFTQALCGVPNRLIGLSWGFDVLGAGEGISDVSWVAELDHVIVDSRASRDKLTAAGISPGSISIIPWGVDLQKFSRTGDTRNLADWSVNAGAPTVLSLRAHEPLYRVSDVISAWAEVVRKYPGSVLIIANEGSLTQSLMAQVQEERLDAHVRFIGRIPEVDLPPILRAVDLYVSTSPVDGTSVSTLQAMACGLPVVVTDIPGNREWVTQGITGRLYPAGDVSFLARELMEAISAGQSQLNLAMAEAALVQVHQRADWSVNSRKLQAALATGHDSDG